jgi:peptide/nickel transport system permease protein
VVNVTTEAAQDRRLGASEVTTAAPGRTRRGSLETTLHLARRKPLGAVSALILLAMVVAAVAAPLISPYDPLAQDSAAQARAPSAAHVMGTDHLGRDVLSRVIYGARVSLWVGLVSVGLGLVAGTTLGLVSGYFKGRTDLIIQRVMDVILAFPTLVLAMALMAILGTSLTNVMLAVGIVMTPSVSRLVRSVVLSLREHPFVESARCLGAGHGRIILRHILPNTLSTIIVWVTVSLGSAILIEASLSFLGLGTQPPSPSWGNMLAGQSRQYFETAPWMALFPGLALSLTVLAFNLLGDALRDVLDPRLRRGV